ncbi:MAG: ATP-dependent zinc metalloprotease FtsH [Acidimicrobiales bacterium]
MLTMRNRRRDRNPSSPLAELEPERRRGRRKALVLCALALPLLLGVFVLVLWYSFPHNAGRQLTVGQFTALVQQGQVQGATVQLGNSRIAGTYGNNQQYWVAYDEVGVGSIYLTEVNDLRSANVPTTVEQQPLKGLIVPMLGILPALILVDGFAIVYLATGMGGGDATGLAGFGRARSRRVHEDDAKVTFAEVAGVDEAVEELTEVRDYLSAPERYMAMGAAVPKGVLLTGPPGCGKTLLARALAGESGVPFFSISGSNFVEMFVGIGAARIRDFFATAKLAAPCIVFIDELDAVGRARTAVVVGAQDERESTLNQLLVEMDGFESGSGVVVLAATNRPDILDHALLRPGRFDRRVTIDRPDVRGREGILAVHARGKPFEDGVDLSLVARRTAGFSGADLANVVNEAALLAARRNRTVIGAPELSEAIERQVAGPERHSRILSPDDRYRIAFHEAGHAVASTALSAANPVTKVSIIARGHGGGFTWWATDGDQVTVTRTQFRNRVVALLAGRSAELLVMGEASSGATSDLEGAVSLARRMVAVLGMGEHLGPFSVAVAANGSVIDGVGTTYSERIASEIDAEVQAILAEAHLQATEVLQAHRASLDALAQALMESESLEGEPLSELLRPVREPEGEPDGTAPVATTKDAPTGNGAEAPGSDAGTNGKTPLPVPDPSVAGPRAS